MMIAGKAWTRRLTWTMFSRAAWARRWHDTQGLGETVGAIGGLLILTFGLTGSLSAFRLWQTHQALEHAASVALRSEEQQGCWTAQTSATVAQAAQGAGLNPQGVKVSAFAAQTADYGQPVSVTVQYTLSTDFLFGGMATWTEQATAAGSSFYVPGTMPGYGNCTPPSS